jgi:hypothetical protein
LDILALTTQQQHNTNVKFKKGKIMIPQLFVENIDLGDGRNITIETGRLAKQADGSVVVRIGKTVILGTVVSARKASPGIDFLPLTVDYMKNLQQQVVFLEVSLKEKRVQAIAKC